MNKEFVSKLVYRILALGLIIPMAIDRYAQVEVLEYSLRYQYFVAVIAVLFFFRSFFDFYEIKKNLYKKENIFFLLFSFSAFLGLIYRQDFISRAIIFNFWTVATLVGIPWLIRLMSTHDPVKWENWIIIYIFINTLIVLADSAICIPSGGRWSIAPNQLYNWFGAGNELCRPTAFYQEPGYFAVFAGLSAVGVLFRIHEINLSSKIKIKNRYIILFFSLLLALVLCTSRLGWLLATVLFIASSFCRGGVVSTKKLLSFTALIAVVLVLIWPKVNHYVGHFKSDGSFAARIISAEGALSQFKKNPLFGVGPGMSGRVWAEENKSGLSAEQYSVQRNSPLALNLYSELLAEWGLIGFCLFFTGLLFFVFNLKSKPERLILFIVLGLIYSSTQTLARYDIWFLLSWIVYRPLKE